MSNKATELADRRPAEISSLVAAGLGVLVAFNVPLTEGQVAAVVVLVGLVPSGVTALVSYFRG